jgi:tripartite-type tricarboxylate transporter receptor subunit TctC
MKERSEDFMSRVYASLVVAAIVLGLPAHPANAQDWPTRPVKIVVPFAAGGSADTLGRLIGDQLGRKFGQQFVVENRGGAGGVVGSAQVGSADPDGYTFVISGIASHVIAPAINRNAGFDPLKNFTHIAYLGGPPIVIVVHPSLGAKSLKDLLAKVKSSKEATPYVSPGAGTLGNLVADYWGRKENVKLEHVPYRGASLAVNDLIAGHVKIGSMTWTTALGQIRGGNLIPLAVSSAKRMPEAPNVPTLQELGYPDLVAVTWFSFSGPANLPKELVQKLNSEILAALESPEVLKRLETEGMETEKMSPEEFTKFVESEIGKWGPVAKEFIVPEGGSAR